MNEAVYGAARAYVAAHISDADEEERWRRTAARRQARIEERVGKLVTHQARMEDRLSRIDDAVGRLLAGLLGPGGGPTRTRSTPAGNYI
mmetsp:Transcript_21682/g.51468  ORF Transcript_21682/g.51468 Transcript_21682/m.51468 type:complete len:89 (-) Transcript_21682:150-416(-)